MTEKPPPLDPLRDYRKLRERAAAPATPDVDLSHDVSQSRPRKSRSGLNPKDLDDVWKDVGTRHRVYFLALLAIDIGSSRKTLFDDRALADRFLDFLGDSVDSRLSALWLYKDGQLVPFKGRIAGSDARHSEIAKALMMQAAKKMEAVLEDDARTHRALDETGILLQPSNVPAVALPLRVGDEVVGVFYLDRHAGGPGFESDLAYLQSVARIASWHFVAAREHAERTRERDSAREEATEAIKKAEEALVEASQAHRAAEEAREDRRLAIEEAERAREALREMRLHNYFPEIVGGDRSPVLAKVKQKMFRASTSNAHILLLGRTGTGKSMIAASIHNFKHPENKRRNGPWVEVDMASINTSLFDAELFGFEKGSFSGAIKSKAGLVEQAHRGTLFFDEIGELSKELQQKLLRLIAKGVGRRIGSTRDYQVDVRIMAATNRDLRAMVKAGEFREDLYYRLHEFVINVPALAEWKEDLPLLLEALFKGIQEKEGKTNLAFTPEALARMLAYGWPGNVRELEGVLRRLVAEATNATIALYDLPPYVRKPEQQSLSTLKAKGYKDATRAFQRDLIRQAAEKAGGNLTHTARDLDFKSLSHFHQMCKRLDLDMDELKRMGGDRQRTMRDD